MNKLTSQESLEPAKALGDSFVMEGLPDNWEAPTRLMEDHRDAYFFWKELGLKGLPCLHIDAHLDLSDLKAPSGETELAPEINCGNYLRPAIDEGIVSELIWVIPDHLNRGEDLLPWARQELQNWLHLELDEYNSLRSDGQLIEGELRGIPFRLCYWKQIPKLDGPILLDIDVDYYLDPEDDLWQLPTELAPALREFELAALTVAYSCQGGYTPVRHRLLGPLSILALAEPEKAENLWLGSSTEEDSPDWYRAALAAQGDDWTEAFRLDPGYKVQPVDQVSANLMRQRYSQAQSLVKEMTDRNAAAYMEGMIAFKQNRFSQAAETWSTLIQEEKFETRTKVYLLTFCGRAQHQAGLFSQATESFAAALKESRKDSEIHYLLARSLAADQQFSEAARYYRKAIKLAPKRLETAEIKLELAEVYSALGQWSLAERLVLQLIRQDGPEVFKSRAETLTLKIALRAGTREPFQGFNRQKDEANRSPS